MPPAKPETFEALDLYVTDATDKAVAQEIAQLREALLGESMRLEKSARETTYEAEKLARHASSSRMQARSFSPATGMRAVRPLVAPKDDEQPRVEGELTKKFNALR